MKKIFLTLIVLLISVSGFTQFPHMNQMREIREEGGTINQYLRSSALEIIVDGKVVQSKERIDRLYLYTKDGKQYWRINLSSNVPGIERRIDFIVTERITEGDVQAIRGVDAYGKKHGILVRPWNSRRGYFYILVIEDAGKHLSFSISREHVSLYY